MATTTTGGSIVVLQRWTTECRILGARPPEVPFAASALCVTISDAERRVEYGAGSGCIVIMPMVVLRMLPVWPIYRKDGQKGCNLYRNKLVIVTR